MVGLVDVHWGLTDLDFHGHLSGEVGNSTRNHIPRQGEEASSSKRVRLVAVVECPRSKQNGCQLGLSF